jgi:hypothetical protein
MRTVFHYDGLPITTEGEPMNPQPSTARDVSRRSTHDLSPTVEDWTRACADRLFKQWPSVDRDDLEHLASALVTDERWKRMAPEEAAVRWLAQGLPPERIEAVDAANAIYR